MKRRVNYPLIQYYMRDKNQVRVMQMSVRKSIKLKEAQSEQDRIQDSPIVEREVETKGVQSPE